MEKHNLEEYFNKRFADHSVHVDKEDLYQNLGIDKDRRRRGFVWFWLGGTVVLIGIIAVLFTSNKFGLSSQKVINQKAITQNTKATDKREVTRLLPPHKSEYLQDENVAFANEETTVNQMKTEVKNNAVQQNDFKDIDVSRIKTGEYKLSDDKSNSQRVRTEFNEEEHNKNRSGEGSFASESQSSMGMDLQGKSDSRALEEVILKSEFEATECSMDSYSNVEKNSDKNSDNNSDNNSNTKFNAEKKSLNDLHKEENIYGLTVPAVSHLPVAKSYLRTDFLKLEFNNMTTPLPLNISNERMWSFGVYSDVAFIDRELIANSNSSTLDFLVARVNSEEVLERIGYGGYLKFGKREGLYGKLGGHYSSINSRLEATTYSNELSTEEGIALTITYKENGDTLYNNYGTLITDTRYKEDWIIYNKQKVLDITFAVGYHHQLNNWFCFVEIQPSLSILNTFSGRIFNGNTFVDTETLFDNSSKYSLMSSFGIGYRFGEHASLYMQPYYQNTKQSFILDDVGHFEKYKFYGVKCGLEWRF